MPCEWIWMNYLLSKSTNAIWWRNDIVEAHIFNSSKTCLLINHNLSRHTSAAHIHCRQNILRSTVTPKNLDILRKGGFEKLHYLRSNCEFGFWNFFQKIIRFYQWPARVSFLENSQEFSYFTSRSRGIFISLFTLDFETF